MDLLAEDEVRIDEGANFHEGQTSSMRTSWRKQSSAKSIRAGSGEGLSQAAEVEKWWMKLKNFWATGAVVWQTPQLDPNAHAHVCRATAAFWVHRSQLTPSLYPG